jgi:prepilin-type N-terminal cleavage/methylation domain-containing protein
MKRARGFTIIELLISLALAGILVAGAFQIHTVFNSQTVRQNQINEVQQSLRLSMGMIERAIRNSGAGLTNGKAIISPGCAGTRSVYRVQYYNNVLPTTWPPPGAGGGALFDSTHFDQTKNPDMLRIVTPLTTTNNLVTVDSGSQATMQGIIPYQLLNDDFLLFINNASSTTPTAYGCLRQITGGPYGPTTAVATTIISHGPGVGSQCVNNDTTCTTLFGPGLLNPTEVRVLRNQTFFRIMPAPGGASNSTKLAVLVTGIGDPPAQPVWSIVADDIEDMQVALLMNDGTVCNDVDDPALCDPSLAVAVRVTLTGVTLSTAHGMTQVTVGAGPLSQKLGYEDTAPQAANDGYIRRSLTSEIILRN